MIVHICQDIYETSFRGLMVYCYLQRAKLVKVGGELFCSCPPGCQKKYYFAHSEETNSLLQLLTQSLEKDHIHWKRPFAHLSG